MSGVNQCDVKCRHRKKTNQP